MRLRLVCIEYLEFAAVNCKTNCCKTVAETSSLQKKLESKSTSFKNKLKNHPSIRKASSPTGTLNRVRYSNTHHLGDSILWVCVANCMYGSDTSWNGHFKRKNPQNFLDPKPFIGELHPAVTSRWNRCWLEKGSKWSTPRGEAFTPRGRDVGSWRSLLRLFQHFLHGLDDVVGCHQCMFPPSGCRRWLPLFWPASQTVRQSYDAFCPHFGALRRSCSHAPNSHLARCRSRQTSQIATPCRCRGHRTLWQQRHGQNKIPWNSWTTSDHLTGPKLPQQCITTLIRKIRAQPPPRSRPKRPKLRELEIRSLPWPCKSNDHQSSDVQNKHSVTSCLHEVIFCGHKKHITIQRVSCPAW